MIKGVGTDIVEISRIIKASEKSEGFCKRVYTARELERCTGSKTRGASLAARFAAKEAVAKALGTGIGKICWTDIEIINDINGKPLVLLHGAASSKAEEIGIIDITISMSHCETYAVAFAVAY